MQRYPILNPFHHRRCGSPALQKKLALPSNPYKRIPFLLYSFVHLTRSPFSVAALASEPFASPLSMASIEDGAVNEKQRNHGLEASRAPNNTWTKSQLMHALEGLDRYPNFLSRWSDESIDDLELSLLQQLTKVRKQKQDSQDAREKLQQAVQRVCAKQPVFQSLVTPTLTWDYLKAHVLDPQASKAILQSRWFIANQQTNTPCTVQQVIDGSVQVELDVSLLEQLMDEEVTDVYSFPVLDPNFCAKVQAFVHAIWEELPSDSPTALGLRNLDNMGLGWLNDMLLHMVVRPMARHLYPDETASTDLDWRHGFLAAYSAQPSPNQPRQRLIPHTDDSEVTLNLCLQPAKDGGDVVMWGVRGTSQFGQLQGEYSPSAGRGLLHVGRHHHEVTQVLKGDRLALVLWARSWNGLRSKTCPCCWLNGRRGKDRAICTCGNMWN
eukprot:Nitzschia sp. Nitz4//scaffold171_size48012//27340//28653//NITZ4_007126-RA/size48012-processed-gene-0.4-mRNA-1//1//CDS//3329538704//7066//frame0